MKRCPGLPVYTASRSLLESLTGFKLTRGVLCAFKRKAPPSFKETMFFRFSGQGEGLLPKTINACDYVAKIPMKDGVDSLNVAAAAAIIFWELRKR